MCSLTAFYQKAHITFTIWSATINHIIRTDHLICYILVHFPLCISRDSFKQIFEHLFIIEIQFKFLPLGLNIIQKAGLFVELYSFPFGRRMTALGKGCLQLPLQKMLLSLKSTLHEF